MGTWWAICSAEHVKSKHADSWHRTLEDIRSLPESSRKNNLL